MAYLNADNAYSSANLALKENQSALTEYYLDSIAGSYLSSFNSITFYGDILGFKYTLESGQSYMTICLGDGITADENGAILSGTVSEIIYMTFDASVSGYVENMKIILDKSQALSAADIYWAAGTDTVLDDIVILNSALNVVSNSGNFYNLSAYADQVEGSIGNDTILGNAGDDIIDGGLGSDSLEGGIGDDSYVTDGIDTIIEHAGEGTDTVRSSVSYTLGTNLENLILMGAAANGTGNSLDNVITGNTEANTLSGGSGRDRLFGLWGNDVYITDGDDVIEEADDAGTDTVRSSASYILGSNIENLFLTGRAAINGTGNSLANRLNGNGADNTLDGGDGNDTLNGGAGLDTLFGGLGDDVYITDGGDVIEEAVDGGNDTVWSSVSHTLGSNVESLILAGTAAIDGTGNSLDNRIIGNAADNTLDGGNGNDTLSGGAGLDTLLGGLGDDVYFTDGDDVIEEAIDAGTDTVRSSVSYTLGSYLENLILTGTAAIDGTGNSLDNRLIGNAAANTLDGGTGADRLVGGLGDDSYITDGGDMIWEAADAGTDTVHSSVSYKLSSNLENLILTGAAAINGTGNSLDNVITGNAAANILNGVTGRDRLFGLLGDDVYITDGDDVIEEAVDAGTDTVRSSVSYTLGSNLENLILTGTAVIDGTGNSLDNRLIGNAAANTLDGGTGLDTLVGGLGDDSYITDGGDLIWEGADAGTDTVHSSVSYKLGSNLENLILTGAAAINGTGNNLDNVITGNAAANMLNGGTGTDGLFGGLGDDIYITDGGDVISEAIDAGTDTVRSSVSYTLGSNLENLILTGTAAIDGTGNSFDNVITGNKASNILNGGDGADMITGGLGKDVMAGGEGTDTFVFNTISDSTTVSTTWDVITDFTVGDKIDLRNIDAFTPGIANDAFLWKGTGVFSDELAGQVRYQLFDSDGTADDYTVVLLDNDMDTSFEMAIKLHGLHNLEATDFML